MGGALRDVLLGRPVTEVDVAVTGDARELAREMEAAGHGTSVELSDVVPRVFRVAGRTVIDIAELTGGSIEADLRRRDFTVNALAWDLESGHLVDPFGGAEDLARRRLRLLSAENLLEDPLRVLRAARLAATHELAPDRKVTIAARAAAARLARAAPERARIEILRLLEAERAAEAMRWLYSIGALAPALGVPQKKASGRRLVRTLSRLDAPPVRRSGPTSRRRLRISLIAAGLGFSSGDAARWLTGRRFSREEAGEVAALLELAGDAPRTKTTQEEWAWIRDAGKRRQEALSLAMLLSSGGGLRGLRRLAGLRPRRPVRVTGNDVMSWLEIPSGPAIGALLREIEIESLRGRVRSRREARKWLRDKAIGQPIALQPSARDARSSGA